MMPIMYMNEFDCRVSGHDSEGEMFPPRFWVCFRNANILSSSSTFDPSQWTFAGANSLEGADDTEELALIQANTTPGTHSFNSSAPIPEPSTYVLLALGIGAISIAHRRKLSKANEQPQGGRAATKPPITWSMGVLESWMTRTYIKCEGVEKCKSSASQKIVVNPTKFIYDKLKFMTPSLQPDFLVFYCIL